MTRHVGAVVAPCLRIDVVFETCFVGTMSEDAWWRVDVTLFSASLVLGGHFVSSCGLSWSAAKRHNPCSPAHPHHLLGNLARSLHCRRTVGRIPSEVAWRDFKFASLLKNSSVSARSRVEGWEEHRRDCGEFFSMFEFSPFQQPNAGHRFV